jgi:hypothetical protein
LRQRADIVEEQSPKRVIQEAIANQHPAKLKEVFTPNMTPNDMLELRGHISDIIVEPRFYKTVFAWLSHDDHDIAHATGILALWIRDLGFQAELFNYLTQIGAPKSPFTVDYNSEEREFGIEMPDVPGWGVSYYGQDNPDVDLVLHALEKFYSHIHPKTTPPQPGEEPL